MELQVCERSFVLTGVKVAYTNDQARICAEAPKYTNNIRLLIVAASQDYYNVTTPQSDFKVSMPWSRTTPQVSTKRKYCFDNEDSVQFLCDVLLLCYLAPQARSITRFWPH